MKYEFWGGPLDGEVREYVKPPGTLLVPSLSLREQSSAAALPDGAKAVRSDGQYVDVYTRCVEGHYHHTEVRTAPVGP